MTNSSPAYQFYPDKWLADTRRLTWKAKGIFKDFLCVAWMQFQSHAEPCTVPNDDDFIAAELGCSLDDWRAAKSELTNPNRPILGVTETNRLFSKGLLKEHLKQLERRENLRRNGAKGGRPKNQKVNSAKAKKSLPSPSPSPSPALPLGISIKQDSPACPTLDEVKTHAQFIGQTPDDAALFWHHFESTGWIDRNGHQILNWRSKQQVWNANSRQVKTKNAASSGAEIVVKNQEYIRLCDEIKRIRTNAAQDAMGTKMFSPAERKRLDELKPRMNQLKKELGITI